MEPFPEEWELLSVFEVEPQILDPGVPWAYNNLTFESTRGSNRILCVIEPGYERLEFTWWNNEAKHLTLNLHWVSGLTVRSGGGCDCLIASFRDPCLSPLRLQLKPTIECEWGTSNELP